MITIYKSIPKNMELIKFNDSYFNKITADLLDDNAKSTIKMIDNSTMVSKYVIKSRFDGTNLNIDKLSTGCKTILNIMYNPDKIFDIQECGDNALDVIYSLPKGNVYCEYPMISFNFEKANIYDNKKIKVIDSYETLEEWWKK